MIFSMINSFALVNQIYHEVLLELSVQGLEVRVAGLVPSYLSVEGITADGSFDSQSAVAGMIVRLTRFDT